MTKVLDITGEKTTATPILIHQLQLLAEMIIGTARNCQQLLGIGSSYYPPAKVLGTSASVQCDTFNA